MNPSDTTPPSPDVDLTKLRNIAWDLWDPIGLLGPGSGNPGKWYDERNLPFADEYDHYLLTAAQDLKAGASCQQVVDYLVHIETQYMCLGDSADTHERAKAVVAAILAESDAPPFSK